MREILFRGKTEEGNWVYGDVKHDCDGVPKAICDYCGSNPIIPETISEFTSLTDKNGTKIFEGDIVSTDITRPYLIVEFRDGCFMFNCNDGGEDYYDIMLPICKEPHNEYKYGEVIGNIHDNPELLKGEQ